MLVLSCVVLTTVHKQDNSLCMFLVGTISCLSHVVLNQQLHTLEFLQC